MSCFQFMKCNVCKLLTRRFIINWLSWQWKSVALCEWDQCLEFWSFKAKVMEAIRILWPQRLLTASRKDHVQDSCREQLPLLSLNIAADFATLKLIFFSFLEGGNTGYDVLHSDLYTEELLSQTRISVLQEEKRLSQLSWIWPKAFMCFDIQNNTRDISTSKIFHLTVVFSWHFLQLKDNQYKQRNPLMFWLTCIIFVRQRLESNTRYN